MMVKELNNNNFDEEIKSSDKVVLVDFWCGPCRALAPIMEEISKDYVVYKVNVDEEEELASKYSISSIPCVIAFKDGKEINRSIGLKPKEEILEMVK